jgi:dihydroxyacetone kinase phosphotransfer subunit
MVGIVVVSHSPDLARAAVSLALEMLHGPAPRIEMAAGTSDDRLGTDPVRVAEAVVAAEDGDGVVVIMDLGSALLSAELALELLPQPAIDTRLVSAAFVEGIFAAVISAAAGAGLDAVARDAEAALMRRLRSLARLRQATSYRALLARRSSPRPLSSTRTASMRDQRRSSSAHLPHSTRGSPLLPIARRQCQRVARPL